MRTATQEAPNKIVNILERTVFISIRFSRFGNSKKVSASQVDVDADKKRIRVSKRLLESEELLKIVRLDHESRSYVESRCLPYEKGVHVLPFGLVEEVEAELRDYERRREVLIDGFIEKYPELIEEATKPLGVLFKESDYLSPSQARAEYSMRWNYLTFSTPDNLRELAPGFYARESAKFEAKLSESYEEWRSILRVAMADLVKRLAESLKPDPDGKTKKLTESSVTKLDEFLSTFSFRNVTDDAELEKICSQVRDVMKGITVGKLRESESLRASAGEKIAKAAATLEVMTQGLRKIRADED